MTTWGYHYILNLGKCHPLRIRCPKNIANFTATLVRDIDMKAYGEPQIVMFGEGNKRGYTLIQLIETSNIAGHFCEETNEAYLDVFSCKPYDTKIVDSLVHLYFQPGCVNTKYIERSAKLE